MTSKTRLQVQHTILRIHKITIIFTGLTKDILNNIEDNAVSK